MPEGFVYNRSSGLGETDIYEEGGLHIRGSVRYRHSLKPKGKGEGC